MSHDHVHTHGHAHEPGHGHAHDPALVAPGFSVLRLSAWDRIAGAGAVSALIWLGVWCASR